MKQRMLDSIQSPNYPPNFKKPKRSWFRYWLAIIMLVLLASGIWLGTKVALFAQKIIDGKGKKISFAGLFLSKDKPLAGEEEGEIRILLMGIGGEKHEGGALTDTLILATIKMPENKKGEVKVGLVSIPRDLLAYIPGMDFKKINSAYAYGEAGGKKEGPALAVATLERLIGKDIPYYGVADFQGFEKSIDDLGGIEITVDQAFTDAEYPDEKLGSISPVTFEKGLQKMDGTRARQFVRSRHGNNNEGSDFARSRRQQKVLAAVRDKILSAKVLTNLSLVDRLANNFADHLRTNLQPHEIKRLYDITRDVEEQNIISMGIDGESGLVCDKIEEETGAYLLIPCNGLEDYRDIRKLFRDQFVIGAFQAEKPVIEIQNVSKIETLSRDAQNLLTAPFLKITIGNYRGGANYQESVIYDNSKGTKSAALKYLKDRLGVKVAASPFPFSTFTENPDFVMILTEDVENKLQ